MTFVQVLLTIVSVLGGGGGIAALVTVLMQRRKIAADAADVITDTALTLVEPLKKRVGELEDEVSTLRGLVRELRAGVDQADQASIKCRRLVLAILDPGATLAALRDLANRD